MTALFDSFFSYQAWANRAFFDALESLDRTQHETEHRQTMRLLNHIHVVAQIFKGHLTGRPHGYVSDNTVETPEPAELRQAVVVSDRWYLDYVQTITPDKLGEKILFSFTDGDKGYMTREEILAHVVMHGGYHRGEVGRLLSTTSAQLPWDTYAVFLHQTQPDRRQQGKLELAY
ncbi:DinB family protein [Agrobacterium vitis]|uniref:DinB family protein n=1 Tax=Agrobacterium vitis TaxID=373 RepID=UPI0012E917A1|nr:DinB family protein [Agrobacterium vitis]MVA24674.1 damage-inducible protein DinB [Agrobacterium vitis]